MANTKSALKRVRQTKRRTERNRADKSRVKTLRRKLQDAVNAGDQQAAATSLSEFSSAVDKAAKRGVIHKNKAANLKSKAAHRLAAAGKAS
jgi:small subunit ribosomal protein S20